MRAGIVWLLVVLLNLAPVGAAFTCAALCPALIPAPTCCDQLAYGCSTILANSPQPNCYLYQLLPLDKPPKNSLFSVEKAASLTPAPDTYALLAPYAHFNPQDFALPRHSPICRRFSRAPPGSLP